jgi:hypothetical protein
MEEPHTLAFEGEFDRDTLAQELIEPDVLGRADEFQIDLAEATQLLADRHVADQELVSKRRMQTDSLWSGHVP